MNRTSLKILRHLLRKIKYLKNNIIRLFYLKVHVDKKENANKMPERKNSKKQSKKLRKFNNNKKENPSYYLMKKRM